MEFRDYYAVMGLERDATADEVKRAYRKLARKYHPDVSDETDAEVRFKELGEAYEVLKDPEKRAAYDQLGADWKAGQDFRPPPDWDAGFEFGGGGFTGERPEAFSDFFEQLFGHTHGPRGFEPRRGSTHGYQMQGEDHFAKVLISVEEAYRSGTRAFTLRAPMVDAGGHVTTKARTLNVRIPKGIRAGQQIRLSEQGGPGMGGAPAGDLYLEVEFETHPRYQVDGKDVLFKLPVAPWEAALGANVEVPTPGGLVQLKVPAGTSSGSKLRLKGRGIPAPQPGDLYALVEVALPPADTDAARRVYEAMREQLDFDPRSHFESA